MMSVVSTQIVEQRKLLEGWVEQVAALKAQSWPYPVESQLQYLAKLPESDRHVVATSEGRLIGYLRMTHRWVVDGTQRKEVCGISTVCVDCAQRGKGVGQKLMAGCNEWLDQADLTGLLRCSGDELVRFYARCGWSETGCSLSRGPVNNQSSAMPLEGTIMTYPVTAFRSRQLWLEGESF